MNRIDFTHLNCFLLFFCYFFFIFLLFNKTSLEITLGYGFCNDALSHYYSLYLLKNKQFMELTIEEISSFYKNYLTQDLLINYFHGHCFVISNLFNHRDSSYQFGSYSLNIIEDFLPITICAALYRHHAIACICNKDLFLRHPLVHTKSWKLFHLRSLLQFCKSNCIYYVYF